jgi:hypothetical protein
MHLHQKDFKNCNNKKIIGSSILPNYSNKNLVCNCYSNNLIGSIPNNINGIDVNIFFRKSSKSFLSFLNNIATKSKIPTSRLEKAKLIARQQSNLHLQNTTHHNRYLHNQSQQSNLNLNNNIFERSLQSNSSSPISQSSNKSSPPPYISSPLCTINRDNSFAPVNDIQNNSNKNSNLNLDLISNYLPYYLNTSYQNIKNNNNLFSSFQNNLPFNYLPMSFISQPTSEQIYFQNLISTLCAFSHCQQSINEKLSHQPHKSNNFHQFQSIFHPISHNQSIKSTEFANRKDFRLDDDLKIESYVDNKHLGINIKEKVDEHFRRSLGKKYYRIFDDIDNKPNFLVKIKEKNKKYKNKLSKKFKKILKSKTFIDKNLVNSNFESKENNEICSNTCNKSSVYSNEDLYSNNSIGQIDNNETLSNDSICLSENDSNKSINHYEKLNFNKEKYENFDGCMSSNECVVDADETQSLILSTTSSVTEENLSINTDTFYDEDEEYIENVEDSEDLDENNNLINNLNNEENGEKVV